MVRLIAEEALPRSASAIDMVVQKDEGLESVTRRNELSMYRLIRMSSSLG